MFAPLEGLAGTVRVVLVLANDSQWHDEVGNSVTWMDILHMDSMKKTDALLEKLVDHEAALLNGQSERVVLMGMSQGAGQSMYRFLRSKKKLGGWIGSIGHVPTLPHVPRTRDPLTEPGRPLVNCDRPVRLLVGDCDSTFSPGLVLRDLQRLRDVGGFTDVESKVVKGLNHVGFVSHKAATTAACEWGGIDA